ncbi:MAG TPA: DUF2142 domain-containing protein [Microbacteriaceae bacterium]|nr:DUF2142 domain-containing protein [Microbacteriaceae bacterium]
MPKTPELVAAEGHTGHRDTSIFLIAFAFIAMLGIVWSLASPLFSIPDENAQATKAIAQVRGEVIGKVEPGQPYPVVNLPPGYAYNPSSVCYLFVTTKSAHCPSSYGDGTGNAYFSTWVATYNPIYYYIVGWPSLIFANGAVGLYAMRIVSALLGALLLAWAFQIALSSRASRWIPFGLAVAAGPMVLYLFGSINPNGAEIAAAAALWVALVRLLEQHDESRSGTWSSLPGWYLWLVVSVSAIVLANARSVGPLWLVIVVVLSLVVCGPRAARALFTRRSSYPWLAGIAAGTIFSVAWTFATGGASGQAGVNDVPFVGAGFVTGFLAMLRRTPIYVKEGIGVFGWLDTTLPVMVYIVFAVALGVLVVLALAGTNRRGAIAMSSLLAAAILVPAIVQGATIARTGLIWQGRYGLFLYVAIPLLAAWLLSGPAGKRLAFLSTWVTWIGIFLMCTFSIVAFAFVLRRYVTGLGASIGEILAPPWQPPLGWETLFVAYVAVTLGMGAWLGLAARRVALIEDAADLELDASRA